MRAGIYIRTYHRDRSHNRASVDTQLAACQELARRHNLIVETRHVFRDMDHSGSWFPSCWEENEEVGARPALGALIDAVEEKRISKVITFRVDRLGTSSELLTQLCEFFDASSVDVMVPPEAVRCEDPADAFAVSLIRKRLRYDTDEERERRLALKAAKCEEIAKLQAKIARLESEVAVLDA